MSRSSELDHEASSEDDSSWIFSFCARKRNKFFCEVPKCYIMDSSNLVGLEKQVDHYQQALNVVLSTPQSDNDNIPNQPHTIYITKSAKILYGLIHARYILTVPGIYKMFHKYQNGVFGCCPRVHCKDQKMLPIGLSDRLDERSVKTFCPKCMEIYKPKRRKHIDGAFFGTSFPQMFFMVLPEQRPEPPENVFVPRLFGFQIHSSAYEPQEDAAAED